MGGTNGGNYGWRPAIENALSFDISKLKNAGLIQPKSKQQGAWQWTRDGEEITSVRYLITTNESSGKCVLSYSYNGESVSCIIPLVTTPLPWAGLRWWFKCPYTGKRARKLYKFNTIEYFCHREAISPPPTYACQRIAAGTDRINDQRWRLRRRLGDEFTDLTMPPWKPKGMHWRTFERYEQRDAELEAAGDALFLQYFNRFKLFHDAELKAKLADDLGITI